MAKQKPQAAPAGESAAASPQGVPSVDPPVAVDPVGEAATVVASDPPVESQPGKTETVVVDGGGDQLTPFGVDDDPAPPAPQPQPSEPTAMVQALVLSDGPFGRCGDVREFDAVHAAAIEAGGFIDTHPNAVASAKGS